MARAALCVVLCAVYYILYTGQCPLQGTSLEVSLPYIPSSHAPPLLLSLAPLLTPSSARFLSPLFPTLRPCQSFFLTRSVPQPFIHSRSHPPSLTSSLPHSLPLLPPSPPSPCSLPPILHPSLPACLPACLPAFCCAIQCAPYVCLASMYCVTPSNA